MFSRLALVLVSSLLGLGCVETAIPTTDGGTLPEADAGPVADAISFGDGAVPAADGCAATFYADEDGDGHGDPAASVVACAPPVGFVAAGDDCDDERRDVSPEAVERCDAERRDDDCSGAPNEGCICDEGMVEVCPGGSEVGECTPGTRTCLAEGDWDVCVGYVIARPEWCNGLDDDCDGVVDDDPDDVLCGDRFGLAEGTCTAGACTVASCVAGHADCNGAWSDSCEITLGSLENCSACGETCGWSCAGATSGCNDVTAIAAGDDFTCALREDQTVVCWGSRAEGRLGDGSTSGTRSTPAPVTGLTGVTAIAAGGSHACAIVSGTVRCWGDGDHGQIGDGSFVDRAVPVAVASITDATALALGLDFSCALRSGGAVSCWGLDNLGQLGNGTTTGDRAVPTAVVGVGSTSGRAFALAAGREHACALTSSGVVGSGRAYCWGGNGRGQLGISDVSQPAPVEVGGGLTGYAALTAGDLHTCATATGTGAIALYCWGANESGQIGDGTTVDRYAPRLVAGVAPLSSLAAGDAHTCAVLAAGTLRCWGANASGQLGDRSTTSSASPTTVRTGSALGAAYVAARVTAGGAHSCALEADGTPTCWGSGTSGEIGTTAALATSPTLVATP